MTAERDDMQPLVVEIPKLRSGLEAGALDAWLHRSLASRFDSTLDETLPAELTTLLSGLH